jgi:hypothetical protein
MKQINKIIGLFFLILGLVSVPLSAKAQTFQERVAKQAIQEWQQFNDPPIVFISDPEPNNHPEPPLEYGKCETVDRYWRTLEVPPEGSFCKLVKTKTKAETDWTETVWNKHPWSGAFISYIMQKSGAGNQFKYSIRHADYIVDAVENRNSQNYPFRGYPIDWIRPGIGDLICAPRKSDQGDFTWMKYQDILRVKDFPSHCDVVVAKNGNQLEVIGGNVGDSVAKTIVSLDANGHIKITEPSFRPWFVVIKNTLHLQ